MILDALDNLAFGTDLLLEDFFSFKGRGRKNQAGLKDGRRVRFEPMREGHVDALYELYAGLSPKSKRTRFCAELTHIADDFFINLAKATVKNSQADGYGLVVFDCETDQLVATCQLVRSSKRSAEFALTIADQWQAVGLGKVLMKRLIQHAKQDQIYALEGVVSHENSAMKLLLMRSGYSFSKTDYQNCAIYKLHLI